MSNDTITEETWYSQAPAALAFMREISPALVSAFNAGGDLIRLTVRQGTYVVGNLDPNASSQWNEAGWDKAAWSGIGADQLRAAAKKFLIAAADLERDGKDEAAKRTADRAGRYFAEYHYHKANNYFLERQRAQQAQAPAES